MKKFKFFTMALAAMSMVAGTARSMGVVVAE